jgi:hypothetical protein
MTDDPELQEIFTDPSHQEILDLLKASRPSSEPPIDPHFRSYLRAKLMTEATKTLPSGSSRPWFGLSRFRPQTLALSMAAVAAGFIVVLGVQVYLRGGTPQAGPPVAYLGSPNNNKVNVPTAQTPIELNFTGPIDKNAVAESVQIEPATSVTKQWIGSTLVIIPNHPLAPNTAYTVRLQPSAVASPAPATSNSQATPAPRTAPTPVVVHFTTERAPIPPVTAPSFRSSNVTWGNDSRLGPAGTILNAVWTATDQLLATRPSGQPGPAASATATPSASASGSPAATGTDVWLLSPLGTPLRNLAPGATLPSAPVSGTVFAAWTIGNGQAQLVVRDLAGNQIATVATVTGTPSRPAVWIGTTKLAYIDSGVLKIVDLQGNPVTIPHLNVDKGSVEASPNGLLLAVESTNGSVLLDLSQAQIVPTPLPAGATGFDWSPRGDLAFLVQHGADSDLYVAAAGAHPQKVANSLNGQTWSDLNWSPDASSILLATRPSDGSAAPSLLVINRDGSNPKPFGSKQVEYSSPEWSPTGDLVLFTRQDEATGGITFQVATASTTGPDAQEQQALAEVNTFMNARLQGDANAAQAELDSNGLSAYQNGGGSLLSPAGSHFDRYYPVTVQLVSRTPSTFLVGVRTFVASGGGETSFVEEQLTVVQQGQKYVIHNVSTTAPQPLDHGPNVVSIEVLEAPPGELVRVRFDADLDPDSVNSSTIEIKDSSGTVEPAQVSFDPVNHLAILSVKLRPGTYQLVVTTGVTDVNNMALAQEYDAPLVISR